MNLKKDELLGFIADEQHFLVSMDWDDAELQYFDRFLGALYEMVSLDKNLSKQSVSYLIEDLRPDMDRARKYYSQISRESISALSTSLKEISVQADILLD